MKSVSPESVGMSSARLERVRDHLQGLYIDSGKVSGCQTLIARRGEVCWFESQGQMDRERSLPVADDTLFRIYSMTKPVTSVALMMLFERGLFSLNDPVHRYIPSWRDLRVATGGQWPDLETRPSTRIMTVRDLLTHTAGLTYGFMHCTEVDRGYRECEIQYPNRDGYTLADMVDELAGLPLEFDPGTAWNYSVATDVCGHLVELLSGQSLDEFFTTQIFQPLAMADTHFEIPADKVERFAACYKRDADKNLVLQDDPVNSEYQRRSFFSGGGGLISTTHDYYRFCQMLINGGELDGHRVLGPRTVDFMRTNHLPGNRDLGELAQGSFSEVPYDGVGFGLGFANKMSLAGSGSLGAVGQYQWGGMASTLFWIDPAEELIVVFMTQFIPSRTFNFRGQLESLIYSALID